MGGEAQVTLKGNVAGIQQLGPEESKGGLHGGQALDLSCALMGGKHHINMKQMNVLVLLPRQGRLVPFASSFGNVQGEPFGVPRSCIAEQPVDHSHGDITGQQWVALGTAEAGAVSCHKYRAPCHCELQQHGSRVLMVSDVKLARNRAFVDQEHKKIFLNQNRSQCLDTTRALLSCIDSEQTREHLASAQHSKLLHEACTSPGPPLLLKNVHETGIHKQHLRGPHPLEGALWRTPWQPVLRAPKKRDKADLITQGM